MDKFQNIEFWEQYYLEQMTFMLLKDKGKMINALNSYDFSLASSINNIRRQINYWIFNSYGVPNTNIGYLYETYNSYINITVEINPNNKCNNNNLFPSLKNQDKFMIEIIVKPIFDENSSKIIGIELNTINNNIEKKIDKDTYKGNLNTEKIKNWGASPGARSSVEQEYFSTQRLYEVNQNYIADYLNYKRIQKGLSKQDLTSLFPKNYKHTVGHWLRKDFGGSIPTPTDWSELSEILDIDSKMTNYVCKTALKIQTVKNAEFKIPDDFLNINSLSLFNELFNDNAGKHSYNIV